MPVIQVPFFHSLSFNSTSFATDRPCFPAILSLVQVSRPRLLAETGIISRFGNSHFGQGHTFCFQRLGTCWKISGQTLRETETNGIIQGALSWPEGCRCGRRKVHVDPGNELRVLFRYRLLQQDVMRHRVRWFFVYSIKRADHIGKLKVDLFSLCVASSLI